MWLELFKLLTQFVSLKRIKTIFCFVKKYSCPTICIILLLITVQTSIFVFSRLNNISVYTGERILKNQINSEVWDYISGNINRGSNREDMIRDAYKFASGIEVAISDMANTGMKFSVISIVPNECVSTVWRLGKRDFVKAPKDQIVSDAILERKKAIMSYSAKNNVASFFIIDSQQSDSNTMNNVCKGYNNFLVLKDLMTNVFKLTHESKQQFFKDTGIDYGIYWFIKFNGEDVVYEFKSTGSHQVDYSYTIELFKLKQSGFSFGIKSVQDFENIKKNTFYLYIKNAIGDKNLAQFLS